jgi:lysophospholipase L1-like esterase
MARRRRTAPLRRRAATLVALVAALVVSGAVVVGSVPAASGSQRSPAAATVQPGVTIGQGTAATTTTDGASVAATGELAPTDTSVRLDLPLGISRPIPAASQTAPAHVKTKARTRAARGVPRPVAAFLGDSYTTGWVGAGLGRAGWPSIVSRAYGWTSRVRAVAGTGFVNPGWTGQPMRTQVGAVVRLRPGIVFVVGGHNDRRFATSRSITAADAVLDRLRRGLPDATLVVIGPIWANSSPPASIRALRDHLRRKARAIGALFIDPLREGWFGGRAHWFIGPDQIHPTNAGHRHIAAMVLADLRAAGIAARP